MAYTSKDSREFQLELFNGKVYEPAGRGLAESMAERGRAIGKPWRIVLPEKNRPAKPVYRTPTGQRTNGRTAKETVEAYLQWAQAHGLTTVSVYPDGFGHRNAIGFARRVVDVADFLGPAPAAEPEA